MPLITGDQRETILVVDDVPVNLKVMQALLQSRYQVMLASDGEEAMARALSASRPDLILLDIMMPGENGYDVCRRLKANPVTADIPVIFVTSKEGDDDELVGFDAGAVDYISKSVSPALMYARIKNQLDLRRTNRKLHLAYHFIRKTFGRYLSEEVVDNLIDTPDGLKLGGEKREVTVLMADLRGFTSLSERLPAETIVDMINIYLGVMTEVIQRYMGTINEFIGDAILAFFGAPVQRDDDATRAVRCAIEMQQAMHKVNLRYRALGYPQVKMGIGINTGYAIVGNIGSSIRSKYGVVGMLVNITSRIESYTVGGQILISETTHDACHVKLRIDDQIKVMPKGVSHEMTIFDIGGVSGDQRLLLPEKNSEPLIAISPLPVRVSPLEGKFSRETFDGFILQLNSTAFELQLDQDCSMLSSLKLILPNGEQLYVKVVRNSSVDPIIVHVRLTYMPEEAETYIYNLMTTDSRAVMTC
ncbi:MAG: adenylate/guanylate cyclase domain-containing response regulator [Zetaproteobacteria bacterium CG12_big_fil_rev_8_21_14_0_65_54_13]|nr:MAG: cyclase [Zetaproteobacteria bacterium CG23_combo_of_CG06-09_8_20_14_all_54_7]PIW48786.1 MAG: adenylate/guanylate cyclase domain-containing response regulator [Zetaproteobacteria bacterium CG12_big_fil_rev_8_21_14_0_65_54_13]